MTIYFTHPVYLWMLLLLLPVICTHYRSLVDYSRFQKNIILMTRMIIVFFVVIAIAGLTIERPSTKKETIFLMDESRSIDDSAKQFGYDYIQRVMKFDQTRQYKTLYFSETVRNEKRADSDDLNGETNMERVLFSAISGIKHDVSAQLVLLSDGNETQGNAFTAALQSEIPITTVPLPENSRPEVQIYDISAPSSVRKGEPFCVNVSVRSNIETSGNLSLFRNGHRTEIQSISLVPGQKTFSFDLDGDESKKLDIKASVEVDKDTIVDNNSNFISVPTEGNPTILMIDKNPESIHEFVKAMKGQGIHVDVRPQEGFPNELGELEKYDAVIFSNIPADALSLAQMEMIHNYVEYSGGGFMMFGGENAFGLGGYYKTPLSEIFPVESDFEKEKEMPGLAIGLVLDRSGSMEGEKLSLTKDAAKGVVELLSSKDYISLIAFDTVPHKIVPLQNTTTPSSIHQMIGTITSEGGTNIYTALDEACQELQRADAKFKHIILLTDGHSTPGDYDSIIKRIVARNITISTVGMGDCDRFLLEKLARDGHGRFYACTDPRSVPQIFARETTMADRSALSENPFFPVPKSILPLLKNIPMKNIPPLLGNVIVRPKKSSEIHLETESGDPLLVSWRYGLGISLAFTSDVNGRWSAEWLDWPEYSRFWSQILRYTMRKSSTGHSELQTISKNGIITVSLEARNVYDEFINNAEVELTVIDSSQNNFSMKMDYISPGKYAASFPGKKQENYLLEAVLKNKGEKMIHIGRTYKSEMNHELDVLPVNEAYLKRIAEISGGQFKPAPEDIYKNVQMPQVRMLMPLGPFLLLLALLIFVLDVYLRRINLKFGIK